MSTPSREHVEKKYRAGKALALYADWLEESNERLEAVIGLMPGGDHVYEWNGGGVATVRDMLRPLAFEAREQSSLWLRVSQYDAESRLVDATESARTAVETGAIREDQRHAYEDAYLAGKRVDPDHHADTQATLMKLAESEELQQHEPLERSLAAGREPFTDAARPLGPPYCDEPNPAAEDGAEPIRCAFMKGHGGPHGWDLGSLGTAEEVELR